MTAAELPLPGGAPMALPLPLPVPAHRLDDLFWGRLLPVLVVLLAASASAAVGRAIALREHEAMSLAERERGQGGRRLLRALLQALTYLGLLFAAVVADRTLHGDPRGLDMTLRFGTVVALLWAGFLGLDALARHFSNRFHRLGRASAAAMLPLLDKVSKAAWALLVGVLFLDNLGLDIKALLAGLGVGGLAIALAGQKTMENLFGGIVLALDQPVRVGDWCSFGDKSGQVEDIGLRSIKIRTADRTLISVPNGEFSQLQLENLARRDRIKFSADLALRLDTGPERLKRILAALQARLESDPQADRLFVRRARLTGVGAYSLTVEVFCYFGGADWEAFLLWRQTLLTELLEIMEKEGGRLALPTQVTLQDNPVRP